MRDLLRWAEQGCGVDARSRRVRKTLDVPKDLDGEPNRLRWGQLFQKFFEDLYGARAEDDMRARMRLAQMRAAAVREDAQWVCNPNELRDLGYSLFSNRAAGRDGLPSNVLKVPPICCLPCSWLSSLRPSARDLRDAHLTTNPMLGGACLSAFWERKPASSQ